ncbi:TonB-dependent receptor [Algiphilus sp.]|uniref:TonB-dependent receptor n=1 Tax=Algiphilus sp. TaxID=1872431 RepID=UPI003B51B8C1
MIPVHSEAEDEAVPRARPQGAQIEEIIVTVSKRAESLQDVSNAVSAFSGRMMTENNIQDFAALADFTPGLVTRNEESLTIRGVGKTRDGASPVAFHVNGFIIEGRTEPFYDLAAVEVLRGPSGTVYGRNATAGAVNVKWQPPTPERAYGGDIRVGSFQEREFRGFANVPLLGEGNRGLNARVAAIKSERQGYFDNLLSRGADEPNSQDNAFARIFLTSEPTDNLRMGLRLIDSRSRPQVTVASASEQTRDSGILQDFGAMPLPDDLLQVRSVMHRNFRSPFRDVRRMVGETTFQMNDLPFLGNVDLDIMAGRQEEDELLLLDLDGTEEPIVETVTDKERTGRNIEMRLTSQNSGPFEWLVGAFWYHFTSFGDINVDARTRQDVGTVLGFLSPQLAPLGDALSFGPTSRIFDTDVSFINELREDRSRALFFNFSTDLGQLFDWPHIEVFGGARQNLDALHLKTDRETIFITDFQTGIPVPFPVEDSSTDIRGDFESTTGEFGGKWFHGGGGFLEEGMLYAKYARGYKPGTVQLLAGEDLNTVDPEILNMVEMGWKASFLRRALTLNLTAFAYDYKDLQVGKIIISGRKLENAGAATINGLELEMQFTPSHDIYTQLSVSLLNARFEEFCGKDEELEDQAVQPGCTEEEPHNFKGAPLSDAPDLSVSGMFRYSWGMGDWGKLVPVLSVSYVGDYQRRPYGNPIDQVDAHTKTDIRLAWESLNGTYRLEGFLENLEDHDEIFADHFSLPDPGAYSLLSVAPGRTIGLRFQAQF